MEFLHNINAHYDILAYGFVVGLVICILIIWCLPSVKERLTVPDNAAAKQLLKFHEDRDPIDSKLGGGLEAMTAKQAAEAAARYK